MVWWDVFPVSIEGNYDAVDDRGYSWMRALLKHRAASKAAMSFFNREGEFA